MVKISNEIITLSLDDYEILKNNLLADLSACKNRPDYFKKVKDLYLRIEDKLIIMQHNQACSNIIEYYYGFSFISCELISMPDLSKQDLIWRYRVYYKTTNQETLDNTTEYTDEFIKIYKNDKEEFEYTLIE